MVQQPLGTNFVIPGLGLLLDILFLIPTLHPSTNEGSPNISYSPEYQYLPLADLQSFPIYSNLRLPYISIKNRQQISFYLCKLLLFQKYSMHAQHYVHFAIL